MHLFQLEIITIHFHAFYITKNGTLLCDITTTLIRQEKNRKTFFLNQRIYFLKKMNSNHFYPKMHTAAQISTKRPALIIFKSVCWKYANVKHIAIAPVVEWLRPPIFSALNHSSSHLCTFDTCETSQACGWSGGFSRGSPVFAPPND